MANEQDFLERLREALTERQADFPRACQEWGPMQWGCALAGEAGELCNLLKSKVSL